MKDVVLFEALPTKFISSFLELYFIFYEFLNFRNVQLYKEHQLRCLAGTRVCHGRGLPRKKKTGRCCTRERKSKGGGLTGVAHRGAVHR
jgi:hypothetical protein